MSQLISRFTVLPLVFTAASLLGGCAALDEMEAENYRKKCDSLGISRSSPAYDNCILQQQALEEESIQHSMDRQSRQHK
ncbi:hypothetical protein JL37_11980 [Achromobacter sp. RTa]|nr:hypothetical protein JL37_11980 [Achromobacter sp. RTa]